MEVNLWMYFKVIPETHCILVWLNGKVKKSQCSWTGTDKATFMMQERWFSHSSLSIIIVCSCTVYMLHHCLMLWDVASFIHSFTHSLVCGFLVSKSVFLMHWHCLWLCREEHHTCFAHLRIFSFIKEGMSK